VHTADKLTTLNVPIVLKSGSLNLLKPSGPLQDCNGNALPLVLLLLLVVVVVVQSNLGSRTPQITNNSVYEQIFRTQIVSDDVLCLELRTRKPSKRRPKQITLDNILVRQRPSGSEAESSGAKIQKKEKESPSKQ